MVHSGLALYWVNDSQRAEQELKALREALDFIEAELLKPQTGMLFDVVPEACQSEMS